jgi:hypothetical protein
MKKYLLLTIFVCATLSVTFGQINFPVKNKAVSQNQTRARLKLAYFRAQQGDLPSIRVVDLSTGTFFLVYYDAISKQLAEESIPLLVAFYKDIAAITAVDPGKVSWASVVFTTEKKYMPPQNGNEERWAVTVAETGRLSTQGIKDLYQTIPHEQTHRVEKTFVPTSSRWFTEGLATWVGLKITERWNPELARLTLAEFEGERTKLNAPLNLTRWGGLIVKKEAILRQVTPEVRERMEEDPTFSPPGPFNFVKDDFINDESNTLARYGASRELFDELDKRAGRKRLQNWLRSIWENGAAINTKDATAQISKQLNIDITERLK